MYSEYMFKPKGSNKLYTLQELLQNKDKFLYKKVKVINTVTKKVWISDFRIILRKFG